MKFDPDALAKQLEAVAKHLRTHGDDAARLAKDWHSPLRAAAGGRMSKGDHGDPTAVAAEEALAAALQGRTLWYGYWDTIRECATRASDDLSTLDAIVVELGKAAKPHVHPPQRTPGVGAGACEACKKWVSGGADDRLRAGYCNACRMAWDRQGRPDRAEFARSRRALADPEDPEVDGHRAHAS